jgi:hypothetical protein
VCECGRCLRRLGDCSATTEGEFVSAVGARRQRCGWQDNENPLVPIQASPLQRAAASPLPINRSTSVPSRGAPFMSSHSTLFPASKRHSRRSDWPLGKLVLKSSPTASSRPSLHALLSQI